MKKDKRHVVRNCVLVVCIVLVLVIAYVFLAFRTDYIYDPGEFSMLTSDYFDRTSVSTVIEEIDNLEQGTGKALVDEKDGSTIVDASDWYEDVSSTAGVGKPTTTLGDYYIYDGLPWSAGEDTYMYFAYRARRDIYSLFASAKIAEIHGSDEVVCSNSDKLPNQGVTIDGVQCMGICVMPAMLDKEYFPDKTFITAMEADKGNSGAFRGVLKIACILVPAGVNPAERDSWLYLPCTECDAKAHTCYGGVVQTNVKVTGEYEVQLSRDWSGTTESTQYNMTLDPNSSLKDILKLLDKTLNEQSLVGELHLGTWADNNIETYNVPRPVTKQLGEEYDVVGFVVWPDSFPDL